MRSRGELSVFANNLGDISVTSTARAVHLTLSFFSLGSRSLIRGDFSSCPARSANCRSAQSVILFARFIPGSFSTFSSHRSGGEAGGSDIHCVFSVHEIGPLISRVIRALHYISRAKEREEGRRCLQIINCTFEICNLFKKSIIRVTR